MHPSGTIINIIGENVLIIAEVIIGSVRVDNGSRAPIIGRRVVIGAGARIIGGIKIGDNVCIGAGAVVVKDIPNNAVAAGNPAKVLNYSGAKIVARYLGPDKKRESCEKMS